jgi:hypothetical protein
VINPAFFNCLPNVGVCELRPIFMLDIADWFFFCLCPEIYDDAHAFHAFGGYDLHIGSCPTLSYPRRCRLIHIPVNTIAP